MKEVELKFQVPASRRSAVESAVAGSTPTRRIRLQAAYFDTPSGLLAGAWIAAETHDPVLLILWLVAVVAALGRIAILLFHHRERTVSKLV